MQAKEGPTITVLMSCHNAERWLGEALDSVLRQTFEDFELIVIDDGSQDDTWELIRMHASYDARVIPIRKENSGLTDSLNLGLGRARGRWIARLDADDVCEPNRFEQQLRRVEENLDCVFVGSWQRQIDERGCYGKVYPCPTEHSSLVKNLVLSRVFAPHSSAFFRADAARLLGGYRTRLTRAQDWDLWLRLSEIGRLSAIGEPLVRIRRHSGQLSNGDSGRQQLIDSRMAIISHWIRSRGIRDPIMADDETFRRFRQWVECRLDELQIFDFYDFKGDFKREILTVGVDQAITIAAKHSAQRPRFMIRLLYERFFGEAAPYHLAEEWANREIKVCAES